MWVLAGWRKALLICVCVFAGDIHVHLECINCAISWHNIISLHISSLITLISLIPPSLLLGPTFPEFVLNGDYY